MPDDPMNDDSDCESVGPSVVTVMTTAEDETGQCYRCQSTLAMNTSLQDVASSWAKCNGVPASAVILEDIYGDVHDLKKSPTEFGWKAGSIIELLVVPGEKEFEDTGKYQCMERCSSTPWKFEEIAKKVSHSSESTHAASKRAATEITLAKKQSKSDYNAVTSKSVAQAAPKKKGRLSTASRGDVKSEGSSTTAPKVRRKIMLGRAGKGGAEGDHRGRGRPPVLRPRTCTLDQPTVKRLLPPGAFVWKGRTRQEWWGHCPPHKRICNRWVSPRAERAAMFSTVRTLWEHHAATEKKKVAKLCPWPELFPLVAPGAAGSA